MRRAHAGSSNAALRSATKAKVSPKPWHPTSSKRCVSGHTRWHRFAPLHLPRRYMELKSNIPPFSRYPSPQSRRPWTLTASCPSAAASPPDWEAERDMFLPWRRTVARRVESATALGINLRAPVAEDGSTRPSTGAVGALRSTRAHRRCGRPSLSNMSIFLPKPWRRPRRPVRCSPVQSGQASDARALE